MSMSDIRTPLFEDIQVSENKKPREANLIETTQAQEVRIN